MEKHHIIFLPGMFAGAWIWNEVCKKLTLQGYKATVIDQCISGSLGNDLTETKINLHCSLSKIKKDTPIVLVGNSLGALIAADFTQYYPKQIRGLVLSGCPGLKDIDWGFSLRDLKRGTPKAFKTLSTKLAFNPRRVSQEILLDIHKNFNNHFMSIVKWIKIINDYNITQCIEQINCPIQLIWGAQDIVTIKQPWIGLSKKTAHLIFSEIDESGHSPMTESPTEFSKILLKYLANI